VKQTRILMDMPITVEICGPDAKQYDIDQVFEYFVSVDSQFSMFRETSEVSKFNAGVLGESDLSDDLRQIRTWCERTREETNGFFNAQRDGRFDPTGLVKGWAIYQAAHKLLEVGYEHFAVEAGGDIQSIGSNAEGKPWTIGIRNPLVTSEIVKVIAPGDRGVATSGSYFRGDHVVDPVQGASLNDIVSVTVIASNVFHADRFATACFAMGRSGIDFLEKRSNLAGYMIDREGMATWTTNFTSYVVEP